MIFVTVYSTYMHVFTAVAPVVFDDPCVPNPCGPNSNPPRIAGSRCQCTCRPEMIGSPPNCRPECVINSECPSDKACINRKCQDPCPGLCGVNAYCSVRNHVPICICNQGYIGDPFSSCYRPISKIAISFFILIFSHELMARPLSVVFFFLIPLNCKNVLIKTELPITNDWLPGIIPSIMLW